MALHLDLSAARAKVARAREHLKAFNREFAGLPEERKPYAFSVSEVDQDNWVTIFITANPILDFRSFGTIIGDAFHNLRCALDYIVTALVEKSPGAQLGRRHQFPIFRNCGYYKAKAGTVEHPSGYLQGVTHGVKEIWDLQPFNGPAEAEASPIYIINRFANADKHRLITQSRAIPKKVLSSGPDGGLALQHDGGRIIEAQMLSGKPVKGTKNKLAAYRVRFARRPTNVSFNPDITMSLEVATPEFDGEPLKVIEVDILETCCDYVSKVLDLFEKL